jgi:acetamidase/formamidase
MALGDEAIYEIEIAIGDGDDPYRIFKVTVKQTTRYIPASGPSYSSGGEPAEHGELEIQSVDPTPPEGYCQRVEELALEKAYDDPTFSD